MDPAILQRRFEIKRPIGRGESGRVFLAEDRFRGGAPVAVKVLDRPEPERLDAFRREYARARRLRHPGLAAVRDLGPWDAAGRLWLSSDFVDGQALDQWAADAAAPDVARLVASAARTLAYLHASAVLHGDIKPAHLIVPFDDPERTRMVDLGLATTVGELGTGIAGTPGYLAPEVLRGEGRSDASDVFALAMSVAVALGAKLPGLDLGATASADDWERVVDRLLSGDARRVELSAVLRPALALRPEERPTAADLGVALDHAAGVGDEVGRLALAQDFVARDEELATMAASWDALAARQSSGPTVLVVEGPPGIGTSRLVNEISTRAQLGGGLVLGGERTGADDPADEVVRQLEVLGLVPDQSAGAGEADSIDGACECVVQALRRLPADTPVLIWLDDVDANDTLARRLIARLLGEREARRFEATRETDPWMICLTTTAAGSVLGPELDAAQRLSLQPLQREACGTLLRRALAPQSVDEELLDRAFELTGGVPELIVAVAQAVRHASPQAERGALDVAQWLPADADALTDLRLEGLPPAELDWLTAVACFDGPAPQHLVRVALRGESPAPEAIDVLRERGLLACTPGDQESTWWIVGELLQRRLRNRESSDLAARRHADVVEAMRGSASVRAGEPEAIRRLGSHLIGAGEVDEGAVVLLDAAERLQSAKPRVARRIVAQLLATEGENAFAQRAQRMAAELDLMLGEPAAAEAAYAALCAGATAVADDRLGWARALTELGDYARALETTRAAIDDGATPDERSVDLEGRLLVYLGHYDEARAVAEAALRHKPPPPIAARLHNVVGLTALYRGDLERAVKELRAALQGTGSDARLKAMLQNSLALALQKRGDRSEAAAMYTASLTSLRQLGDKSREASRLLNLGTLDQDAGDWDRAFDNYRAGLGVAVRRRSGREVVRIGYNLANLLIAVGALDEAERIVRETRAEAERLAMRVEVAFLHLLAAEIANARQDPSAAEAASRDAAATVPDVDNASMVRDAGLQSAEAARLRQDFARARAAIEAVPNAVDDPALALLGARIELDDPDGDDAAAAAALRTVEAAPIGDAVSDLCWKGRATGARLAAKSGDASVEARRAQEAFDAFSAKLPVKVRALYARVPAVAALLDDVHSWLEAHEPNRGRHEDDTWGSEAGLDVTRLQRILQINKRLGRQLELRPLLELILDEAIDLTQAERGFVLLAEGDKLAVRAARHLDLETLRRPESKLSHSVARQVVESGEPVITVDAMDDERFREQLSVSSLKLRSIACVPLMNAGRTDGALYLDNRFRKHAFSDDIIDVLIAFADQASIALAHARMRQELIAHQADLEASRQELERLNEQLRSRVVETAAQLSDATELLHSERDEQRLRYQFSDIIGRSRPMMQVLALVDRLAKTDFPVFIHGESGTGKELVARAIHNVGGRSAGPFIAVNCAAIPETLLESELFGHKRGAFTGAISDRRGLLSLANGGTLFFDEIGDMPLTMQAKLLRVLEDKTYRQLGGEAMLETDVRVVSASNKDIGDLVEMGAFREDLFYRLNAATVRLPPLRQRVEDIPDLVAHLLQRAAREGGRDTPAVVTPAAFNVLMAYGWPGNVRELDNELRRATALADGDIDVGQLSERLVSLAPIGGIPKVRGGMFRVAVAELEQRLLTAAMQGSGWDAAEAAKSVGLSRSVFYAKLKKYTIRKPGRKPKTSSRSRAGA